MNYVAKHISAPLADILNKSLKQAVISFNNHIIIQSRPNHQVWFDYRSKLSGTLMKTRLMAILKEFENTLQQTIVVVSKK